MTTPQDLYRLPVWLMQAMQHDPRLCLAQAATWLDPVSFLDPEWLEDAIFEGFYQDDEDSIIAGVLVIARRCLPITYFHLIQALNDNACVTRLEEIFRQGLHNAYPYLEMDTFYDLQYGIPLPFVGLDIPHNADFITAHPDKTQLLTGIFGLPLTTIPATQWRGAYEVFDPDAFEQTRSTIQPLIRSLIAQDSQPYADLALMTMHLFSMTGSTLLDMDIDDFFESGFEPLEWEPDTLAYANEACHEVTIVLSAIDRAEQLLIQDTVYRQAFTKNVAALSAAERKDHDRFDWPAGYQPDRVEADPDRETGPHVGYIFVRDCYAKAD